MSRLAALLVTLIVSWSAGADDKGDKVYVVRVQGVINTGTARYLSRGLEVARDKKGALLAVVLNTPGGLLTSTREIVQRINVSSVPVAVFVAPGGASATSAGTIVTMAAHFAGMAPGTNIGAAHPVGGQGEDIKGAMNEKAVNDTVAFIKAQAALRGRNAQWAEQAIRKSVSATADEALAQHVVDFIAPDLAQALLKIDGKAPSGSDRSSPAGDKPVHVAGLPVIEIPMTAGERFLAFIGDPNISYLLMVAGGLGLYVEITSPGVVLPGVLGAIAMILAFVSFSTLPVNYGAVALLALGLVLFLLEAFITSYGVLTIGGIVSLVLGALLLMDPSTGDLRLSLALVVPTVLALGLITAFIGFALLRARRAVSTGSSNFEGYEGVIQSVDGSGRSGKLLIRGETWDFALPDAEKAVHVGERVVVSERQHFKLVVRRG